MKTPLSRSAVVIDVSDKGGVTEISIRSCALANTACSRPRRAVRRVLPASRLRRVAFSFGLGCGG
jgi:hypothetical protein